MLQHRLIDVGRAACCLLTECQCPSNGNDMLLRFHCTSPCLQDLAIFFNRLALTSKSFKVRRWQAAHLLVRTRAHSVRILAPQAALELHAL